MVGRFPLLREEDKPVVQPKHLEHVRMALFEQEPRTTTLQSEVANRSVLPQGCFDIFLCVNHLTHTSGSKI